MVELDFYFESINKQLDGIYNTATKAKETNIDINNEIEIPITTKVSDRVVNLIATLHPIIVNSKVSERIEELEHEYEKQDYRVAFQIAEEIVKGAFFQIEDRVELMNLAIRVAFAYITMGIISAPLEGFLGVEIKQYNTNDTNNNKEYICINYAGPIRAAGGTAGALTVVISDHIRKFLGFKKYDPTEEEIKRYFIEIEEYNKNIARLQYYPKEEEINFLIKNLGVEVSGSGGGVEVSSCKNLERVHTDEIRNGSCLILAECLLQKSNKLLKIKNKSLNDFELENWDFLEELVKLQKNIKSNKKDNKESNAKVNNKEILPNYNYISEIVGGRPVFSFPMAKGGFRLRYGRTRVSGFASYGMSSETIEILNDFVALGTQLRVERPGKSTVITHCDSIEKPIVKLKSGEVIILKDIKTAKKHKENIEEILHLGDLLIAYGDFLENNHKLIPSGYCEEIWGLELINKINKD